MANLARPHASAVKGTYKEIHLPGFPPQIRRPINIEAFKNRSTQSIRASNLAAAVPSPVTAAPTLTPKDIVEILSIEASNVRALVAELLILTSALRPLVQVLPEPADPSSPVKPKRKYTPRKSDQTVVAVPIKDRKWITIKQAAAIYPKSEQAFRHFVHQASQYQKYPKANLPSNGFEKCVVRQQGSRNVYLNADELERWMTQSQGGV